MEHKRELLFFKNYFSDFFKPLNNKLKGKIDEVLFLVRIADRIPSKFFRHLTGTDGLFEIRELITKATSIEFSVASMKGI